MADATPDTTTPDISQLSPEQIPKLLALLHLGQGLPNVQPDQTPVDTSGFWGGLRHGISLLGEAAGSPGPETLKALSPEEREQAGLQSLSRFGTGLMAASHYVPGQTLGSNLAQGFQAAEHGYDTTARQAMGMLAARQGYAVQSQQADLEKLKAALPLLSLQQQLTGSANTQKLLSGQVTPGTNIGSGGSIAPPDPNSPAGQVATRTAAFWSSQGYTPEQVAGIMAGGPGAESSFNPGAKGDSGDSHGLYQHQGDRWGEMVKRYGPNPTEAQQNEFAAWEISPQGTHADVGAALKQAKTPQEAAAIWTKGFERPKDADAKAAARAGVAGQYLGYGATPTPAPGQATTPPARGATIPSEPPLLAGGAQAAGGPGAPGAPTSGVIPTLPPAAAAASAADVAQIEAGRAEARANPMTPAVQPGAVVTAQAGGQQPALPPPPPIKAGDGFIVHPGTSYQEFFKREAVPPPTTEDFNPNLSPARQAQFDAARQGIQQRIANRPNLPIAAQQTEATKIIEDRAALEASIQKEMADKSQAAATNVTKWNEHQEETIRPRYEQMIKSYDTAAQSNLAQQQALDLEAEKGKQSRLSTAAGAEVERGKAVKEALDKDSIAASGQAQSLGGLQALSDNVDDSHTTLQSLANVKYGGTTLLNHLANMGVVAKGDAGPIQMLQSGISGAITQLRAGIQMGSLSDRDLSFIESMGPSLYEDKATRTAVIKYLQQAAYAKMRFNTIYNEEITRPGTNPADALERSRNIMDAKHPIVPQMPAEVAAVWNDQTPEAKAARTKWAASNNVRQNSLVRQPDGSLMLLK